ncbi:MAG: hypothetical protein LBQ86_04115 [Holophagales bacterium]|nr:hypothetical protein [Holophagales bacterium]
MLKAFLSTAISLSALFCASQEAPKVSGAVAKPGFIDSKAVQGLNKYTRLVKIADSKGGFLCSLELSGYALRDVLERKEIKKENDGFDRPLDTFITAKGRDGKSVLFSYGEAYLGDGEGVLLADGARMILPHRHPPLEDKKNDPAIMLDVKKRGAINLESCASCHDGEAYSRLHFPKGWLLIAVQDGFAGRFIEDLTEITVAQVGIKVESDKSKSRDYIVESPTIIGPEGKPHEFKPEDFNKLPRLRVEDAGIGLGRGYRGTSVWEGVPLKGLLQHFLPKGVDPRRAYVLVTAADGYRCLYSGAEVFNNSDEKCALMIDRKNGEPLGKGAGVYAILPRGDFFVDRHARMVKEVRLVIP